MHKILIIDDDPAVIRLLQRGLSYEGYSIETATSGEQGLALLRDQQPDLVLLDVMMLGLNGLDVLRQIRARDAGIPVLLLTAKDAPSDQVLGLELGADDYVTKPFTFEVLLARIHALFRRRQAAPSPVLRFADLELDTGRHQVRRGTREIYLTSLEFQLLEEFLRHPRQVLSKELLLDRVWGYDFEGSTNVVEVYVKQLRQKLEAAGEDRLLQTLRGVGYVLREE